MFSIFKNRDLGYFGVCFCKILLSNALCIFQSSGLECDRNREKRGFLFKTHSLKSISEILWFG